MEQQEIRTTEQLMTDQAAWSFRREGNIRNALHDLREHPEKLLQRRAEFDHVIRRLNSPAELSGANNHLPTLTELADLVQYPGLEEPTTITSLARERIFTIIRDLIEQGSWGYVRDLRYPEVTTSTLLIEGYALMLEEHLQDPEIGRLFVLAFEEILWTELRGTSIILEDVISWMIEERHSFHPRIRRELEITYLIMSANSIARYNCERIDVNMHHSLIRIYRETPDFDIVTRHCEASFVKEIREGGTSSLLIRLSSDPEDTETQEILEDMKEIIHLHCSRASSQSAAPRYGKSVIFIDICVPDQYKKEIASALDGFEANYGHIEESIYSREQEGILELVWISR